jgi:ribosomal protein S12 methylthiotransferase accessory factor
MDTPHRSLTSAAAVALAEREADRMGLRLRLAETGPANHPTVVSELVGPDGTLAVGYGKGSGAQAVASAHFESLERFVTTARDNRRFSAEPAVLWRAADVAAQEALRADLVIARWAAEFPESPAACTRYDGEAAPVWYPLFLVDPRYHRQPLPGDGVDRYRSLIRYTSSLGTAAGADPADAVLHGLCELIEHDAVSLALLRWFVAGAPEVDTVRRDTVPDGLRKLWRDAEVAVGSAVHLFDVTTDIGVPVYLATAEHDGTRPGPAGAGASPLAGYAAERALAELIQYAGFPRTSADPLATLARWPALRDCALLPVRRLLSGRVRRAPLRADLDGAGTVASALALVTRLLRERGVEHYHAELSPAGSLVRVAAVIAPGLERFSLVRLGQPVVPTGRGWPLWTVKRIAQSS